MNWAGQYTPLKGKLVTAVSPNMLKDKERDSFKLNKVSVGRVSRSFKEGHLTSAVGHPSTAGVLSDLLGTEVVSKRETLSFEAGDRAVLCQYQGPRLPEGAKELPGGATLTFYEVRVINIDHLLKIRERARAISTNSAPHRGKVDGCRQEETAGYILDGVVEVAP